MFLRDLLVGAFLIVDYALAIGQPTCVSFKSSPSAFSVVSNGRAAPVFISSDDWPGVLRAASDFATDIQRVTGTKPSISNVTASSAKSSTPPIIIGTLGSSSLVDAVVNNTKIDVSSIKGQWEAFMAKEVNNPLPGVSKAYVIIGADKRGTIFALYDHSEQFGVSPWYWWADVPTTKQNSIFIAPSGCSHGSPTVKYRGIFLNDEQPALQNWAMEKFAGPNNSELGSLTQSPFNHFFYNNLFELLLRLKANYLWPAQWSSAFGIDDKLNQFFADYYGVVMGTSHEEPMMRSIPVEWNLFGVGPWDYSVNAQFIYNFWVNGTERSKNFESLYTVGMRGNGDLPAENTGVALLEKVISDQRQILVSVYGNNTDVTTIPQSWCLYKEVQGYYDEGMTVPDDITLLWTDDNYGNVRRYPTDSERNRTGGAGVYYHYDYVGDPRDYKWITSTQISKVYEQMSLAVERQATQIWVVNVGDLKPYEMSIEFWTTYGWNASRWDLTNLDTFTSLWAQREFDLSAQDSGTVATIVANLTRSNSRRKPELLNGTTFSLTNYNEADNVLAAWKTLNDTSTAIYNKLPSTTKPAFFQLVHHAVLASSNLGAMWIASGMNNLRASQAFLSTNGFADEVAARFEQDYSLEVEYHTLLDGKWDHMMDQTHVGYYYWQQPMANTMPPITRIQAKKQALAGVMRLAPQGTLGAWPGDNPNQCAQGYSCPPPTVTLDPFMPGGGTFIDIGAGGPSPFTFTTMSNATWLKVSPASGSISPQKTEQRVSLSIPDWSKISGTETAILSFTAKAANQTDLTVSVTVNAAHNVVTSGFKGFVEGSGAIAMEAAHATRNTSVGEVAWTEIPGYGRTLSGVTPWPRMGNNGTNYTAGTGPSLEYDFHNFATVNGNGSVIVTTYVSPSNNANGLDRPLALAVQMDAQSPVTTYFMPSAAAGAQPPQWDGLDGFAADNIVPIVNNFAAAPGPHTLKLWMIEPAVVVQRIVINTGGLLSSYLGPPESTRV